MTVPISILLAIAGTAVILGLYWLVWFTTGLYQRHRLQQAGRTIPVAEALARVRAYRGFFVIAAEARHRDLFYFEGEKPENLLVRDFYGDDRAILVEGYSGKVTREEMRLLGIGDRCLEVDVNALSV